LLKSLNFNENFRHMVQNLGPTIHLYKFIYLKHNPRHIIVNNINNINNINKAKNGENKRGRNVTIIVLHYFNFYFISNKREPKE
jgi:hypothetical protein